MRFSSVITLVGAIGSLMLSFLALLGGYSPQTLPNGFMFSVNVSHVAHTIFNNGTSSSNTSFAVPERRSLRLFDIREDEPKKEEDSNKEGEPNKDDSSNEGDKKDETQPEDSNTDDSNSQDDSTSNATTTVWQTELGIAEVYFVYAINVCEGKYMPNFQDSNAQAVITRCLKPSPSRQFDLSDVIQGSVDKVANFLNTTGNIQKLGWPDEINHTFQYVKTARTAMAAFFILGLLFLILSVIASFAGIFRTNQFTTLFLLISSSLALLSLTIAVGIATTIITTVVNGTISNGDHVGVNADQGQVFLGLFWVAVALLFISTLSSAAQVCMGSGHKSDRRKRTSRYSRRSSRGSHDSSRGLYMHPGFAPSAPPIAPAMHALPPTLHSISSLLPPSLSSMNPFSSNPMTNLNAMGGMGGMSGMNGMGGMHGGMGGMHGMGMGGMHGGMHGMQMPSMHSLPMNMGMQNFMPQHGPMYMPMQRAIKDGKSSRSSRRRSPSRSRRRSPSPDDYMDYDDHRRSR